MDRFLLIRRNRLLTLLSLIYNRLRRLPTKNSHKARRRIYNKHTQKQARHKDRMLRPHTALFTNRRSTIHNLHSSPREYSHNLHHIIRMNNPSRKFQVIHRHFSRVNRMISMILGLAHQVGCEPATMNVSMSRFEIFKVHLHDKPLLRLSRRVKELLNTKVRAARSSVHTLTQRKRTIFRRSLSQQRTYIPRINHRRQRK